MRRIFSCTRAGQACIFLFIQLQRPSPSTMQTPSPMVLRMRLACWLTRARSRGRKSAGFGKDGAKLLGFDQLNCFFDAGGLDDVALDLRELIAAVLTVVGVARTKTLFRETSKLAT